MTAYVTSINNVLTYAYPKSDFLYFSIVPLNNRSHSYIG